MLKSRQTNWADEQFSKRAPNAVDRLMKGYMCSGAIVITFASEFGLKPEIAARISFGFAGGMAMGKTCGAVTGAIMVIGLKYGAVLQSDQYSKDLCSQMIQEFSHRFIARRKSLECSEILLMNNINPKDPEEMKSLRGKNICAKVVQDSAEILEELLGAEPL